MYKVKIFFGSFYGEWFENDFLEDMDWSDISVAECMIEAHFPVVPAHGSIVDVSSLRSQIYKGWKKYMVGTDEDVFYGVCLTPNTDYIKIEIY